MAEQETILIRLSEATLDELSRCTSREERGRKLLAIIDGRIDQFNRWCERELGGQMAKFELAAVRTYLYREITGELEGVGDIDNLPHVQLDEHPVLANS